ncbi:putative integral membrane protein [Actinoplanes missouriensis 431]|uniref:Putative integral membrane protein n=1 Tax=Actinoplanes missouriensis (strain ATCC 14538 / DSM 43046 / CBS 188.64 / JCM 3121 / NBRC 102363 / NCIMB 12654 / NRRL B-3342 / UNCC 431) TaxID=512565 RepID=I0HEU2_ACTM4|nr:phage holin family protein [Actinoplanes missouriensis]BAL91529.1 putative integral membrane protein [Actinoplanes missouriensis 431]
MADVLNGPAVTPIPAQTAPVTARPLSEQSTGELVQRASEQISKLVRDELTLAKAELAEKGKHAGIGAGLFGGAGVLAGYGVGALIATLVIVLDLFLDLWLAALIVTVVLFLVAGVLALLGKKQVSRAVPPEPSAAIQGIKADVDEVKHAVKERSRA